MTPTRTLLSGAVLLAAACASLTGCAGSGSGAAAAGPVTHSPAPSATASTAPPSTAASPTASAPRAGSTATGSTADDAASTVAPCGNGDLRTAWGYGTQGRPLQAEAVVFTNVGTRSCTLKGYPGLAVADAGTVINAARVLNGFRGDQPPLKTPPLVTLAPGAAAHAMVQWLTYDGRACYPTGTGVFEVTAPDTTNTIILSRPVMGRQGICSGLDVNPVAPGTDRP